MSQSAQQRKQGTSRSSRKEANRAATGAASSATAPPAPKLSPRAAEFRARRGSSTAQATGFTLTRAQEMVYIRADLRRLIYIAGSLLVLLLVILYFIDR